MGGGKDGKGFVTVVDSNARNKIVYPGSFSDADFYSRQFGEIIENEIKQTKAYGTFAGFKGFFSDKISESVSSTKRARFTPEDIVFRPFGEITYCLIKNNSIQTPGVSKIQYIPRELNDTLDRMVAEYNELQISKASQGGLDENKENNDTESTKDNNNSTSTTINQSKENGGFIDICEDNDSISKDTPNIINNPPSNENNDIFGFNFDELLDEDGEDL